MNTFVTPTEKWLFNKIMIQYALYNKKSNNRIRIYMGYMNFEFKEFEII
jgi:hypothetical protein